MDDIKRYWTQFKSSPPAMITAGGVIILIGLIWFVASVRESREDKEQGAMWGKLYRNRTDLTEKLYMTQEEYSRIVREAQAEADFRVGMMERQLSQGQRKLDDRMKQFLDMQRIQAFNGAFSRRIGEMQAKGLDAYQKGMAAVKDEEVENLRNLAEQHAGEMVGPWMYFHLGSVYFAKGRMPEAISAYEQAQKLAKDREGSSGAVLVGEHYKWLEEATTLAKQQAEWAKKLETQRAEARPTAENPILTLVTAKGSVEIELYVRESPRLVRALCELVDAGYYDGRALYGDVTSMRSEKLGVGSPFDDSGDGELGEPLPTKIIERKHTKGTVSMETLADDSKSSTCRFFILKQDPEKVAANPFLGGAAGGNPYNGVNAVVGQVKKGLDVLEKLSAGDRILKAHLTERGELGATLVAWPRKP